MYTIIACPQGWLSKTVTQSAPNEKLRDLWLAAYARNNWDVISVEQSGVAA